MSENSQVLQHVHIGSPRRKRKKRAEKIFEEMMAENFPNLKKETDVQLQKAQRSQIRQTQTDLD